MASNREERRLMRQRGAGTQATSDFDFGLTFPLPAAPEHQNTLKELSPEADILSTSNQTPSAPKINPATGEGNSQKRVVPTSTPGANDANTSAKRRRLDGAPPSSIRSTRSRYSHGRSDPYELRDEAPAKSFVRAGEDYSQEIDELEGDSEQIDALPEPRSLRKVIPAAHRSDEVRESPTDAPGSGRRQPIEFGKVKAAGSNAKQGVPFSGNAARTPTAVKTPKQGRKGKRKLQKQSSMELQSSSTRRSAEESLLDDVDELSPDQPRDRRDEQFSEVEEEDKEVEAEDIDDIETARRLGLIKASKKPQYIAKEAEKEHENSPELEPDELTPRPAKPTKQGRKKARAQAHASPAVQRQPKKSKPRGPISKETIPVTVHRFSKPLVYGENDEDADILNMEIPFAKRGGVNAVDVFSQICEEVIDSGLTTLDDGLSHTEDPSTRKEYRTKMRAVEAFQEELRTNLLELTVNVDNNYSLSRRLKASKSEIDELHAELHRIRQERQAIAIRADAVRIKHEADSKNALDKSTLNNSLHDIELAVERCKALPASSDDPPQPQLSSVIKSVAGQVSSKSSNGGILAQVKDFNGFLERAALALEGR